MSKKQIIRNKTSIALIKILKEKVVTETDLIYIFDGVGKVNGFYKNMVEQGYPLRRRTLESIGKRKGGTGTRKPQVNHRVVIYYFE